uniref:Uncharacterized protein n=1 Tax=Arundo donax TaxID=35708 RepID=A0A0A9GM58_ARUDO
MYLKQKRLALAGSQLFQTLTSVTPSFFPNANS